MSGQATASTIKQPVACGENQPGLNPVPSRGFDIELTTRKADGIYDGLREWRLHESRKLPVAGRPLAASLVPLFPMLLWLIILASPAYATRICSLSSTDVQNVINHYGLSESVSDFDDVLTAPFDCDEYGDLCEVMGEADAEDVVCGMWGDLTSYQVMSVVTDNISAWQGAFPSFDQANPAQSNSTNPTWTSPEDCLYACVGRDLANTNECERRAFWYDAAYLFAEHRVRVKAYYNWMGVVRVIGGNTKGYERSGGSWNRDSTGYVEARIQVGATNRQQFESVTDYCIFTNRAKTRTANDGFVDANYAAGPFTKLGDLVGVRGYYEWAMGQSLSGCSYRMSIMWHHPDCDFAGNGGPGPVVDP